jgi:hypothetical protein
MTGIAPPPVMNCCRGGRRAGRGCARTVRENDAVSRRSAHISTVPALSLFTLARDRGYEAGPWSIRRILAAMAYY